MKRKNKIQKFEDNFLKNKFYGVDICPYYKSNNNKPVELFDYIKKCNDCKKEFIGHIHN